MDAGREAKHTPGPFWVDSFGGDWAYVVSEAGIRMAECTDGDKAEQVCDALNAMHYIAKHQGGAA